MTKPRIFSKGTLRKGVFFIHLWLGLIIGLYFSVIGMTGSVLVFREDIEASQLMPERSFVAPPAPDSPLLPLSQIITRLRSEFPDSTEAQFAFINPAERPDGAYSLRLTANRETLVTTIDPYTAKVIHRYSHEDSLLELIERLHVDLLFKAPGKVTNGYGGLLSALLLLSGIWLWWPATLRQIKIRSSIKKGAPWHRVISDLHNVLGIYPFVLLWLVTITGSVIVFYKPVQDVVFSIVGVARMPRAPLVQPAVGAKRLPIENLVRIAEQTSPNSHFVFLMYPTKPNQPFYAYRRATLGILPDTRIYLDPYNGKILQVGRDSTDPTGKKIMRSASTIHFGRWGSTTVKIIYFILGFIPLGLFVTGILMYLRKLRANFARRARRNSVTVVNSVAE